MTAERYFNALVGKRQKDLQKLRTMIIEVLPDVVEDMSYKLPTYSKSGLRICAIANQKHYMALYIMNYDLLDAFKDELKDFNCGKSCIRFKKLDKSTLELFKSILLYISTNINESQFFKK